MSHIQCGSLRVFHWFVFSLFYKEFMLNISQSLYSRGLQHVAHKLPVTRSLSSLHKGSENIQYVACNSCMVKLKMLYNWTAFSEPEQTAIQSNTQMSRRATSHLASGWLVIIPALVDLYELHKDRILATLWNGTSAGSQCKNDRHRENIVEKQGRMVCVNPRGYAWW